MSWIFLFFEILTHADVYLAQMISQFGHWSYAIVSLVIFIETGIVIAPFMPGDSLMFVSGAFAARGILDMRILFPLFAISAIVGDSVNYLTGYWSRGWMVENKETRWIRRDHLDRAHAFYEKHGARMIVLARFIPVIRSFAPFVAGLAGMPYKTFLIVNALSGLLWTGVYLWAGYVLGNTPVVQEQFSLFIVGIAFISFIPLIVEAFKRRRADKRSKL